MIKFEHLNIEEFRGIRSLDLPLNGNTFVIYGPNGSGKSGVVDAIDFVLTGSIARLEGDGTGGVTLRRHGPHVLRSEEPAAAKVELQIRDVESDEVGTLSRTLKEPTALLLEPDTPTLRSAVQKAANHPELTLSRRELLKYIISKPGERAAEIQALLQLGQVESTRKVLKRVSSGAKTNFQNATRELDTAQRSIQEHLGASSLDEELVLKIINERREIIGVAPLKSLTTGKEILHGTSEKQSLSVINLTGAQKEIEALRAAISDDKEIQTAYKTLQDAIKRFTDNPALMDTIQHRKLFELGLGSIEGPSCPLCNLLWDSQESLHAHITERIVETETAQEHHDKVIAAARTYSAQINKLRGAAEQIATPVREYGSEELPHLLKTWTNSLARLEGSLGTFEAITAEDASHSSTAHVPSPELIEALGALATALQAVPDQSQEEEARAFLHRANERWTGFRVAAVNAEKAEATRRTADAIYKHYCAAVDDSLMLLYEDVEQDFSRYYQFINADDEQTFRAELLPSAGSLGLKVDFYQTGLVSPVAYHSEGHQDGMGVCLYLALVKQLLGSDFQYAVLDDVVMSVDTNHRRRFAELLKKEFGEVQFVITTHDEVWARQMRSVGLVKTASMARFHGWTVEAGPIYGSTDIWAAVEEDLKRGDVAGAAHKVRRALEAKCSDIAERLGGSVVYRSDSTYDLSIFVDSINERYKTLLGKAQTSAESWKNQDQIQRVKEIKQRRSLVLPEQNRESWIINKLVHNNDWVNATEADFRPALDAAKDFLSLFRCENPECESWITIIGRPGSEVSLHCDCQSYNLNLKRK